MESENPAEVGQRCPEPTSCSAWRVVLSPYPQITTPKMAVHAQKNQREKSSLHKRRAPRWIIKGSGFPPHLSLALSRCSSPLSLLFLSAPDLHMPCSRTNAKSTDWEIDFPPSHSLLCLYFPTWESTAIIFSHILNFVVGVGRLWNCVVAY